MTQIVIQSSNTVNQTRVMSLRLSDTTYKLLESLSERKKIKTSALTNQVIDAHLNFCVPSKEGNMMPLSKDTIRALLEGTSDDIVTRIAASAGKKLANILLTNPKVLDLHYFLQKFLLWMNESGITSKYDVEDGKHIVVLYHDMGRKMSLYLADVLKRGIEMTDYKAEFEMRERLLVSTMKPLDGR